MSFHQIPLRDWFAGLYMQGQVSRTEINRLAQMDAIADDAYSMADAMMRARDSDAPVDTPASPMGDK